MGVSLQARHLKRYGDVAWLLAKYGRPELAEAAGLGSSLDSSRLNGHQAADALELAADLEKLGPTFIKLGQLLSTRTDLLPVTYTEALSRLQDKIDPVPYAEVEAIVSSELGIRISKAFAEFDPEPIATASLGQVHRARLHSGREVVVKVQRPDIEETINDDLEAFEQIAAWIDEHTKFGRAHHLGGMLEEFRKGLIRELDYQQEAQNLVVLGRNLADFKLIVVPQPVEDLTSGRVLTMDRISGVKVTKLSELARLELPGRELASELFRAYLHQILVDGFFHADPHPGNVFVTDDRRIALLDLGQVAHIAPRLQSHLTQLVLAISEGRPDDVVTYATLMSERTSDFDEAGFTRGVTAVVTAQQDKTLAQMEVGRIVLEIFQLSGNHGLVIPGELSMLGKALLNLDQVARALDPDFNPNGAIRDDAAEIMRQHMTKALSPGNLFQSAIEAKDFLERLPARLNRILDAVARNEFEIKVKAIDEDLLLSGFQKIANRITMGLVMAALIIGAAMLMQVPTTFRVFGYPALPMLFYLMAVAGGIVLVVQIVRSDRRT